MALVELGSGSAVKTRLLMEVLIRRHGPLLYIPVDISRTALLESSASLARDFEDLEILAVAGDYADGLEYLSRGSGDPRLILWLGSNIGNFERPEAVSFLRTVRQTMSPYDRLLAGIDLCKDASVLEPAYDDAQGVTARFNKNILTRINRELDADFDLDQFEHRAHYNEDLGRVEMYLVSASAQMAAIRGLDLEVSFSAGEAVHTENSYKYSSDEINSLAEGSGMDLERQWMDRDRRFSVNILAPRTRGDRLAVPGRAVPGRAVIGAR
jgi:dimethylhistidine N-methyltransferase